MSLLVKHIKTYVDYKWFTNGDMYEFNNYVLLLMSIYYVSCTMLSIRHKEMTDVDLPYMGRQTSNNNGNTL